MTESQSIQQQNESPDSGAAVMNGDRLRLEAIAGPPIDRIVIVPDEPVVLGRSSVADRQLTDKTVSRRHCRILKRGGYWLLADLNSRHGTFLNGIRLEPEQPAPLNDGDLVRIGPWTLRVIDDADRSTSMPTTNDLATTSHRVQRVPVRELRSVAQQRLDLLIECCAAINAATSERDLGEKALDAVSRGTGFRRAAFIRQVSSAGDVQVIAAVGPGQPDAPPDTPDRPGEHGKNAGYGSDTPIKFSFSRSLINAAGNGEIVRMTGDSGVNYGESIIRLGIHAALCAPIMLGDAVEAYLYLDARDAEDSIAHDAAAFCQAISRMCGLALGNLKRIEHEKKNAMLSDEIRAAREAQVRLMPPALDTAGAFEYAMQSKPGRTVAGDLFDVVPLDDGRLAVFLGDVIGKGAGAAILMATAQAEIRMALTLGLTPERAIRMTNRSLHGRSAEGEFVSLWLGVLDPEAETLEFVDAGHGLWFIVDPDGGCRGVECEGGLVLGVKPDEVYKGETTPFPRGARLILYSDGLPEQQNPEGEQFGSDRARAALTASRTPRDDTLALARAVHEHAQSDTLSDDLTIASIAYANR